MLKVNKKGNVCEICGKKEWVIKHKRKIFLCAKHKHDFVKFGRARKRTTVTPNKIIDNGKFCEMDLYNKNGDRIATTFFNRDKLKIVKKYKWRIKGKYVSATKGEKTVRLHRLVMKANLLMVDHVDGNTLDNRKENLRFVNPWQNSANRKSVGVYWKEKIRRWQAGIGFNNKQIYLGVYKDKGEAIKARKRAENYYFGIYKRA